jgi:hypothetical protein
MEVLEREKRLTRDFSPMNVTLLSSLPGQTETNEMPGEEKEEREREREASDG